MSKFHGTWRVSSREMARWSLGHLIHGHSAKILILSCVRIWTSVALVVKNLPANAGDVRGMSLIPGWGRSRRRAWQPTPVFLPGESHGQRSLAGYRLWSCKESDMTEWLSLRVLEYRLWWWLDHSSEVPIVISSTKICLTKLWTPKSPAVWHNWPWKGKKADS